jgi:hypothetical protein
VDVENNLVYRVSGFGVYTPHGPFAPQEANTIRNNIVAFARLSMVADSSPYKDGVPTSADHAFLVSNNLFYFDRNEGSGPPFRAQAGCTYSLGFPFTSFLLFNSNLYWRTDGGFASDAKAFHVQPNPGVGANAPCSDDKTTWTFYTFSGWQGIGEDLQSVVRNPGFTNPAYPADDYSLPHGSPGAGFVVFDATQAGRSNPVLKPPAVAPTFPIKRFDPATDY